MRRVEARYFMLHHTSENLLITYGVLKNCSSNSKISTKQEFINSAKSLDNWVWGKRAMHTLELMSPPPLVGESASRHMTCMALCGNEVYCGFDSGDFITMNYTDSLIPIHQRYYPILSALLLRRLLLLYCCCCCYCFCSCCCC